MNFETQLELAETQWHDAQLCRLSYSLAGKSAEAVLELRLYATPDVPDRHVRVWRFLDVHDLLLTANGPELQSYHDFGHVIRHGSMSPSVSTSMCISAAATFASGLTA
jgi:hypothetical protein